MNDLFTALTDWNKLLMTQIFAAAYFTEGMKSYSDELSSSTYGGFPNIRYH